MALCFAALAVAVAGVLSVALSSMLADKVERDESIDLRSVARNAAKALADGLASRTNEIRVIAASPTLWSAGLAADRVVQTIARTQALTQYSAWIGVAEPTGIVRAATGNLLVGVDVSQRPWFQEAKSGVHVGDVHDAKLLGSLLPKGRDGEPQRFVDFAAPIVHDGRLLGVLGMHGSWEWTRSVVEALLPEDAAARGIQVLITNRAGAVIYRSEDRASAPSSPASAARVDLEDSDFLTVRVPVTAGDASTDLGWTVVAREPQAIVQSSVHSGNRRAFVLGGLAAIAACALGWLLAERLTRPMRSIARSANRVQAGCLTFEVPDDLGSSEVTQLSGALRGMMTKLVEANEELESRVRARTAELEVANAELDRQARVDPLTGLLNRRGFEDRYVQALSSAKRRTSALSVLMVDIDHFKRVNDTYGHDVGDTVLKSLASLLIRRLRDSDTVARLGGEEFVVLLPDTGAKDALVLARQLVQVIDETHIEPIGRLTISCGVAQVRERSDTAQSVLNRADSALYRAKNAGRNRAGFADSTLELAREL